MMRRFVVVLLLAAFAVPSSRAFAGCGSECSCPLDNPDTHLDSRLLFDVSQLYIDQNQPMIGADDAFVGAIPGHHDEVRTVNRISNFRLTYRTQAGWVFGANLPYIHRTHEHIHHHMGEDHYQRWNDRGLGDLEISASRTLTTASGPRFRVGFGVKAPTGKQDPALSEDGDPIEPSARIGTGAWDVLANLGAEWRFHAPGKGPDDRMPLRVTLAGRYNGAGIEEFRHGAEVQVNVGTEYPVARKVSLLLQSNYRLRAKDDIGEAEEEEEANTGGAALYATPGLRFDALPGFSIYGLAQIPLYERVNGIQVVAESNLVLGISRSIY
ncbi:MAG TPA: hypothetical protein VFU59_02695 [Candidatus Eisenbacteria bacterium]|nr:hypothetical protein [Candidatus Eisenbacteria bacterium]